MSGGGQPANRSCTSTMICGTRSPIGARPGRSSRVGESAVIFLSWARPLLKHLRECGFIFIWLAGPIYRLQARGRAPRLSDDFGSNILRALDDYKQCQSNKMIIDRIMPRAWHHGRPLPSFGYG